MPKNAQSRFVVVLILVAVAAAAAGFVLASTNSGGSLTSSQLPPQRLVYISDADELTLSGPVAEQTIVAQLSDTSVVPAASVIESIEPLGANSVFVGFCCVPSGGRQLIVDLDTGRIEFFPLTIRFPSASASGSVVLSGGRDVRVENLGALLAYENGVGVVAPGPAVGDAAEDEVLRPASLPMDRAAFVSEGVLTVTTLEGEVLVETGADDIEAIGYDERNDVLVALVASDGIRVLSPETLDTIMEWPLDQPALSIDVQDGWLLTTDETGSIDATRIDGSNQRSLIASGARAASWLPS